MTWVHRQTQFTDGAKADFARSADGWLVAYAMTKGGIIVTHERYSKDKLIKVPLPNVCRNFGVQYVDTFKMLRELGIKIE